MISKRTMKTFSLVLTSSDPAVKFGGNLIIVWIIDGKPLYWC